MSQPNRRIALLNLNHIHHAYHIAPIAFELGCVEGIEAELLCSTREGAGIARSLGEDYPGARTRVRMLSRGWERWLARIKNKPFPRISTILQRHQDELLGFDAVVSPDFYSNPLLDTAERGRPLFVFSFHGAGDGAYGFDPSLGDYDLLLLAGEKVRRRLVHEGILMRTRGEIAGYPKFDLVPRFERNLPRLFAQRRPTVLYNPHFAPKLSSWHAWGREVLELFAGSEDYNLIFAPHIMLFGGKYSERVLPRRVTDAENIHIDLGSQASANMTYTLSADIYLGDASSQVYEFLYRPRPTLFLNPNGFPHDHPNYRHWVTGPVLDRLDELPSALENAVASHRSRYAECQEVAINETFSSTDIPAARRGAQAIVNALGSDAGRAP